MPEPVSPEPVTPEPRSLCVLAEAIVRETAGLLRERRTGDGVAVAATKSTPTDIVTAVDTAAEELIRDRIGAARPRDTILGEEGGRTAGSSAVSWIVDPLDGTVNYLYDLPIYGVSIAAAIGGEVVAGAVSCPPTGEVWTAVRGAGATLNGRAIRASGVGELSQALVGTGFWYDAGLRARQAELLRHLLPRVRDIRRIGSAAVDLCHVGTGRLDAFYETGLHPWDYAAGLLVAEEAGAVARGVGDSAADGHLVLASAPGVVEALHELLTRHGGDVTRWEADPDPG